MTTERQVKAILARPFDHKWTIQGFGMLRTYIDPDEIERLHIWNTDMAVPEVSVIHDHPWDFESRIISGTLTNQRYYFDDETGDRVFTARIKTGEGGGLIKSSAERKRLVAEPAENYGPGGYYRMEAPELHESMPSHGAVTLIRRRFLTTRDDQFATVCWRKGLWVSAEPREATRDEILAFLEMVDFG